MIINSFANWSEKWGFLTEDLAWHKHGHLPHDQEWALQNGARIKCKRRRKWKLRHNSVWKLGVGLGHGRNARPVRICRLRKSVQVQPRWRRKEHVSTSQLFKNSKLTKTFILVIRTIYVSFGGLLMSINGEIKKLKNLEIDSRIYLLLSKIWVQRNHRKLKASLRGKWKS